MVRYSASSNLSISLGREIGLGEAGRGGCGGDAGGVVDTRGEVERMKGLGRAWDGAIRYRVALVVGKVFFADSGTK